MTGVQTCALPIFWLAPRIGKLKDAIAWCGKYSLELYLANVLDWYILNYTYSPSGFAKLGFYLVLQVLFSGLLILANRYLQKAVKSISK